MQKPYIAQDDLTDIIEMTNKLEEYIFYILEDSDMNIAVSALISATINSLVYQCDSTKDVISFRNLFMNVFDHHIKYLMKKNT